MQYTFLNSSGVVLFVRNDAESAEWTQEEYTLNAVFPYVPGKVVERGQRIYFRDPVTNNLEMFEVRNVTNIEPEHYQQIIAEHVAVSELSDEHINNQEITDKTPAQALTTVLSGTLWAVGNVDLGTVAERNRILSEISALGLNGNVDLTDRPIISPETMHNAGYTDFDGDYATLYSMTFTETLSGGQLITTLFTPIRVNGTVLSQEQIDDYVITLHGNSASISALKANDTQGLLIHALSGEQIDEMDAIAETAHDLSDEWETLTTGGVSSVDISRGSVWQAVKSIEANYNVYITPRVTVNTSGAITGRYLDIAPAQPVFRGLRLSFDKNMYDPAITYDDTGLYTALYGYGGSVDVPQGGGEEDETQELTFASVVWTATQDHPAKPDGQTYLEDPAKTALYGRNGRPRFGYYQNSNIKDADVLIEKTWETLKTVSDPVVSIVGTVSELTRLGKIDVPVRLHDSAIIEIRPQGVNIQKEIIKCTVNLEDTDATRVEIGAYIPNIIYINRETAEKSGGGGGGGGHGQTNQEHFDGETYSDWVKTNDMIGMVVGTYNGGYKIKAGEITLAINEDGGTTAKISADAIDIDGIIEDLETVTLKVAVIDAQDGQSVFSDIFTTDITVDDTVDCYTLDVSEITAGGSTHGVSWQSYTARYCATTSQNYTFVDSGGTSRTGRLITSITDTTIHYLGY